MKSLRSETTEAVRELSGLAKLSPSSGSVARPLPPDQAERDRMFLKLFALYPPPRDMVATMAAYDEETRDIPAIFISHALRRLRDQPVLEGNALVPRRWLPSVAEIRHEAARVIRAAKLASEGKDAREYSLRGDFQLNPERWIEQGREVAVQLDAARLPQLPGRT